MAIKFRYNNTTYTLLHLGARVTTPSLCYRQNGTTYYAALLTSRSQTIGDYVYSAASPTICCRYNNTTYYAARSRESAAYNIPAGTYVGQSAYNIFHSYISNGGHRRLAAPVTIRHMNITKTFSAGQYVWLSYGYSGEIINLTFGSWNSESGTACDAGGNSYKQWWSSSAKYPTIQLRYNVSTGTWSTNSFTLQNNLAFA